MIFLRYSRTLIEANCYILADSPGSPALVVDPGAGSAAWIDQTLQRKGLSLGAVLCTHGHMDHVWDSGLVAGEAPVFIPGPDLYRMDDPVAYARPLGSTFEAASGHGWVKPEGTRALPGVAIRALPAPGHTEGSSVFLLNGAVDPDRESAAFPEGVAGQALMLSGDVLFRDGVGRTDLHGGDPAAAAASLRTLVRVVDPATVFFPGHGPASTVGRERAHSYYLRQALAVG